MYSFGRVFLFVLVLLLSLDLFSQDNPKPDTICEDADIFCDSASLYGPWTLPDSLMSDQIQFNLCNDGGAWQNIYYFPFVASSEHVQIIVSPITISPHPGIAEYGYQYGIIGFCVNQENKDEIIYYDCSAEKDLITDTMIDATGLKPGYTYYLYIDGYEASNMTFNLKVLQGIGNLSVDKADYFEVSEYGIFNPDDTISVCKDGSFTFKAFGIDSASSYIWYSQDTLESSDSSSLIYRFKNDNSIYKICVQGYSDCDIGDSSCIYVKVDSIPDEIFRDTSICANELSIGFKPEGWKGSNIKSLSGGTFRYNVKDSVGCHYWQQIQITKLDEPITNIDSVLCSDSLFYNGDTITSDTILQKYFISMDVCDSVVNKHYYFFDFNGEISALKCNGGSYLLRVNSQGFNPALYDSVRVTWFLNNNFITESNSFDLFPVNTPGKYYATVTLYKNNNKNFCSFDLPEIEIKNIPSADFLVSKDTICTTDSLLLDIISFIDSISYKVEADSVTAQKISEGKYKIKWYDAGNYKVKVSFDYDGCVLEAEKDIVVQPEISIPVINCIESTNSSIIFDWKMSDCVESYEVWIDGAYVKTLHYGPDTIKNLNFGQEVNIEVRTKGNCSCDNKSDYTVCSALPCPDRTVTISGLPLSVCFDEMVDSITLGYDADTVIVANWGGVVDNNKGIIYKSGVKIGENIVILDYEVGDCKYRIDTSFEVYPPFDVNLEITDLSCFDSNDGSINILANNGGSNFYVELNNSSKDSLFIDDLDAGEYYLLLKDDKGCIYRDTFDILQPEEPGIDIAGSKIVKFNNEFKYYLESDSLNYDSIYWYKNDSLICYTDCDTLAIIPDDDFELCAQVFFDSICQKEICIDIRIDRNNEIYVPDIFTPDFDGINDYFNVMSKNGLDVHIKTMRIYNRWGELLFEQNDFVVGRENGNLGWNGIFRGKKASQGVYVYYIEVIDDDGEISKLYGDVTLIR